MNVTIKQASLGLIIALLTLLVIATALLFWQHSLGTHASVLSMIPFGIPTGC